MFLEDDQYHPSASQMLFMLGMRMDWGEAVAQVVYTNLEHTYANSDNNVCKQKKGGTLLPVV